MTTAKRKTPIYKVLYFQVICAIVIGILLGTFMPEVGAKMKPLGVLHGGDGDRRHGKHEDGGKDRGPGAPLL